MKIVIFNEWGSEDGQDTRLVLGIFEDEKKMNEAIDSFVRQRGVLAESWRTASSTCRSVDGVMLRTRGEISIEDIDVDTLYTWGK